MFYETSRQKNPSRTHLELLNAHSDSLFDTAKFVFKPPVVP